MTTKEKELFEKKVTIKDWLVIKLCNILNLPKNYTGTIVCMDFNTPKVMKLVKAYFHQARVIFMEQANFEKLFGISGLYYKDEGERTDMLKSIEGNLIIIANPPYGAIGANIAYTIREKVNYECFVNLLPANDYKRNKTKDLFNYQSEMEPVNDGFNDAAVTTHLALISKTKANNMSEAEFTLRQFIDRSLDKYFIETNKRKYDAFENNDQGNHPENWSNTKTVIMGFKDSANGHMPYSRDCNTYRWNVEKSIDSKYLITNCNYYAKSGRGIRVPFVGFTFNTELEHDNFIKFFYSAAGFKFMSKVITALNADSWVGTERYMPKVDWTRSWTVEEILKDYGYTEDEIKTVMADLDNFKGMDD